MAPIPFRGFAESEKEGVRPDVNRSQTNTRLMGWVRGVDTAPQPSEIKFHAGLRVARWIGAACDSEDRILQACKLFVVAD